MHRPFTLLIHIALVIIVTGAIVTHYAGIQGVVTLREAAGVTDRFEVTSGPSDGRLPFAVALEGVEIVYYPGTTTPMDFRSILNIGGQQMTI